jgi:ProP effector
MRPSTKAAHATIELLAATWPKAFSVAFNGRQPLKVGIGREIATATEGAITPEELAAAMSVYTGHKRYLRLLKEGAQRVDLDGLPAGVVTPAQARHAEWRIERLEELRSARARARGLAADAAARKGKAETAEAKRAAEITAGKRKPLLRLPGQAAAHAA